MIGSCLTLRLSAQDPVINHLKEVKVSDQEFWGLKPVPAQRISAEAFKRYGAVNVAEAVQHLSGVNIKDYGGIGGLKTISVRSLGASQTAVLYDGILMNDAQNGQVDLGRISLNSIAEIILFNGQPDELLLPARAFASSSALIINPAVPNVSRSKPVKFNLALRTGSFGRFEPMLNWEQRLFDYWSYQVNVNVLKVKGDYPYQVEGDGSSTGANRNNADVQTLQSEASVHYLKDSTRFNLRLNYQKSERGLPGAVIFYSDQSAQRLWSEDLFLQSRFSQRWRKDWGLLLNFKYAKNYSRYIDPDYLNDSGGLDQRYNQQEIYQSAALSYRAARHLELAYAVDGALTKMWSNQYQYAYPERITLQQVLSGKLQFGQSKLQASLLYTLINEQIRTGPAAPDRNHFAPALTYSISPFAAHDLQFRAFYKSVFRNPGFNDLYYSRIGYVNLKPELSNQYNIGLSYTKANAGPFSNLSLTADTYFNQVRDKIIAIPTKDLFSWSMRNLGKVAIKGMDISLKSTYPLNIAWDLNMALNYTYQQARDVTDPGDVTYQQQIPYTPLHSGFLNLGIRHKKIGIYLNQQLNSSRYFNAENIPANRMKGIALTDLNFTWQLRSGKLPLSVGLEMLNLFNEPYAIVRSFPMPGRSYRLSLQIQLYSNTPN